MSRINRGGKQERPNFVYNDSPSMQEIPLQLLESIRNTLEQIRDGQVLQCSVASDIRRIREVVERSERRILREKREQRKSSR